MTPLRKRMMEEMLLRNFAPKTVKVYVDNVAQFAKHFGKSPERLGREQVREYLLYLVEEKKVAWGTYNQVLASLRYLYRWVLGRGDVVVDVRAPKRVRHLPVVLSLEEVSRFFAAVVSYKYRMALITAYSAGLRISEVVNLQVNDIDSERMLIHVREAKRSKDRYTMLSPVLLEMLRHYCWAARPVSYVFPGSYETTADETVLAFVKANKNPTTKEINTHWKSEGRGHTADNTLVKLVKTKQLKRIPLKEGRGSTYEIR